MNMTQEELYDGVRGIRDFIKENRDAVLTERYKKEAVRIFKTLPEDQRWAWYAKTASRSAYFQKATLKALVIELLRRSLQKYDKHMKEEKNEEGEKEISGSLKLIELAKKHGVFDKHNRKGGDSGRWTMFWQEHAAERPKAVREARKHGGAVSKRRGLGKLPDDWQEQIAKQIPNIHLDFLAITGCRPSELAHITAEYSDEGLLTVFVQGSKVKDTGHSCGQSTGQELRTLVIDTKKSEAARRIFTFLKAGRKIPTIEKTELEALRKKLARVSETLFPGIPVISFYSYRHQLMSNLKEDGMSPEKIASIAGHQSTKTQQLYGRSGSGNGGHAINEVHASRPVRSPGKAIPGAKSIRSPRSTPGF